MAAKKFKKKGGIYDLLSRGHQKYSASGSVSVQKVGLLMNASLNKFIILKT